MAAGDPGAGGGERDSSLLLQILVAMATLLSEAHGMSL